MINHNGGTNMQCKVNHRKGYDPNKQHLPLEITQNFTVQWADFWRLWQIGIHAKKTLNLTKSKTLDRVDSILRVS